MAEKKAIFSDICCVFDCGVNDMLDMVCVCMILLFIMGSELIKIEDKY